MLFTSQYIYNGCGTQTGVATAFMVRLWHCPSLPAAGDRRYKLPAGGTITIHLKHA
jgi:hypothetical protein